MKKLLLALLLWSAPAYATTYCISATGSDTGAGTSVDPFSLKKAIGTGGLTAGIPSGAAHVGAMLNGTYTSRYAQNVSGAPGAEFTLRPASAGECGAVVAQRAVILDSYQATTLAADITGTTDCTPGSPSTYITLASTSGIMTSNGTSPGPDNLIIYNGSTPAERVRVLTIVGNQITNCLRGLDGTSRNTATSGSTVVVQGPTLTGAPGSHDYYVRDLIIQNSWDYRVASTYPDQNFLNRGLGIVAYCLNCYFINNVVKDGKNGHFSNSVDATTTLNGAIGTSTCSSVNIVLTDGTYIFNTGLEVVQIDSEQILVGGKSGTNTINSCTRGYNGTVAASHSSGATVTALTVHSRLFYGALCFNNGAGVDPQGYNGQCFYVENKAPNTFAANRNVMVNNASNCIKYYSESAGHVQNMSGDRNICSNSGAPWTFAGNPAGYNADTRGDSYQIGTGNSAVPETNNSYTNSVSWQKPQARCAYAGGFELGYQGTGSGLTVTGNYLSGCNPMRLKNISNATITGNTFHNSSKKNSSNTWSNNLFNFEYGASSFTGLNIDSNTIYDEQYTESVGEGAKSYDVSVTLTAATVPGCCTNLLGGGIVTYDSTNFFNLAPTTVNMAAGIDASSNCAAINIIVASGTNMPTNGGILIDSEVIRVTARSGTTITGCTRGFLGTTATTHANGATVYNCTTGRCNQPTGGTGGKQWMQSAFGASNTYTRGAPTTNVAGCFDNAYETGRQHCYRFNFEGTTTWTLASDLSTFGLSYGDTWAVWDPQNWSNWDPVSAAATGTYCSDSLSAALDVSTLTSVVAPTGGPFTPTNTSSAGAAGGFDQAIFRITGTGTCGSTPPDPPPPVTGKSSAVRLRP